MERRSFLKMSAASLMAMNAESVVGKVFDTPDNTPQMETGNIRIRFLGTGAADWNGQDERGELRRLSSILVDKHILIDLTAENLTMIPEGCKPDILCYTHSHGDHYHPESALKAGVKRIYLSHTWYDIAKKDFAKACKQLRLPMPEIIPLFIGQTLSIGDLNITPLPASHATGNLFEQTLIYLLEKAEARVLYATDTGGIPAVAARMIGIDAHDPHGKAITGLIMEATMGMEHDNDFRSFTHSSVGCVHRIVQVLEKTNRYTPQAGQPVYLTHLARTLHGTQAELDANLPHPLKAAYDGLEVIF